MNKQDVHDAESYHHYLIDKYAEIHSCNLIDATIEVDKMFKDASNGKNKAKWIKFLKEINWFDN